MPNESQINLTFKTLADPTRRAVVARLVHGPAPVSDLAEPFDMALPSFMQHMRIMEEAGLLKTKKQGRKRICSLAPDALRDVEDWLSQQRAVWNARFDRLEALLDEEEAPDGS